MSKLTLYDVALEGMILEDILTANDGELTPELEARFDKLLLEGPQKIESAAMVIRELQTTAAICKAEATRLNERKLSLEKQADKLKERVVIALDAAFNGKVKTALFTIYTQKNPDKTTVELAEEYTGEQLHEAYPELAKTEYSLDKAAVLQLWSQNKDSVKAAKEILANPKSSEQERAWATEIVKVIPDCVVIEDLPETRSLRIR